MATNPITFRTTFAVAPTTPQIELESCVLSAGSCFCETIGARLIAYHFNALVNPWGVLFNPLSLGRVFERLLSGRSIETEDLETHDGLYFSFLCGSGLSAPTQQQYLDKINNAFARARAHLAGLDFLLLTWGTAQVWFSACTGEPVANCHRMPADNFTNRLVSVDEICRVWEPLFEQLVALRPGLRILLTVSPVRHLRNNPWQNTLSKSTLHLSIARLAAACSAISYFPAYELLLDDLRDYRFYAQDMAHPAEIGERYIWEQFCKSTVSPRARAFIDEYTPVLESRRHRITNPHAQSHKRFVCNQLERIAALEQKYAPVNLEADRAHWEGSSPLSTPPP